MKNWLYAAKRSRPETLFLFPAGIFPCLYMFCGMRMACGATGRLGTYNYIHPDFLFQKDEPYHAFHNIDKLARQKQGYDMQPRITG